MSTIGGIGGIFVQDAGQFRETLYCIGGQLLVQLTGLQTMRSPPPTPSPTPHRPRTVRIVSVAEAADRIKCLSFEDKPCAAAEPGQFGMVWAPGADEMPMSLLPAGNDLVTVTVKERGEGTRALLRKMRGDLIGIRGPYGRGFTYTNEKSVLMVAGGTGAIPLVALLHKLGHRDVKCTFILGANTASELLFAREIERLLKGTEGVLYITTDDGSAGVKGLATDKAAKLLRSQSFDRVYTCGPEVMTKRVVDLGAEAHVPAEAGLERIFKCGSAICGSCCIGPYLVCKDGPVFKGEVLRALSEFGRSTRDASGKRVVLGKA